MLIESHSSNPPSVSTFNDNETIYLHYQAPADYNSSTTGTIENLDEVENHVRSLDLRWRKFSSTRSSWTKLSIWTASWKLIRDKFKPVFHDDDDDDAIFKVWSHRFFSAATSNRKHDVHLEAVRIQWIRRSTERLNVILICSMFHFASRMRKEVLFSINIRPSSSI